MQVLRETEARHRGCNRRRLYENTSNDIPDISHKSVETRATYLAHVMPIIATKRPIGAISLWRPSCGNEKCARRKKNRGKKEEEKREGGAQTESTFQRSIDRPRHPPSSRRNHR